MSTSAAAAQIPRGDAIATIVRATFARLTWRTVAVALLIAIGLEAWSTFELVFPFDNSFVQGLTSTFVVNVTMAACMTFTTLFADELTARGAKRFATYGWSVVVGSAIGTLSQWQLHQWFGIRYPNDIPGVANEMLVMRPVFIFFEYLIWGSIIVFIYVSRRNARLAASELNAASLRRTDAQRRTLESRLKALQARVEPEFLFDALAQVRDLYEQDPARGSAVLGDLIVYLRAALPQLRESTSTLGHEIDLVAAYRNVMRAHAGPDFGIEVDAPEALRAARMPPMVLLPIVNRVLQGDRRERVRIAARRADGALCLAIAHGNRALDDADALRDVEKRLHALYGDGGTLEFASSQTGMQVMMRIPYETADSAHR